MAKTHLHGYRAKGAATPGSHRAWANADEARVMALNETSDTREHRIETAQLFRQVNAIWKELALELMVERTVINRWSMNNGGTGFPDVAALDCTCKAHAVVKAAIRDYLAQRAKDIDRLEPKPA